MSSILSCCLSLTLDPGLELTLDSLCCFEWGCGMHLCADGLGL